MFYEGQKVVWFFKIRKRGIGTTECGILGKCIGNKIWKFIFPYKFDNYDNSMLVHEENLRLPIKSN